MPEVQTTAEMDNEEEWIDLFTLIETTNIISDRAWLYYEYDENEKHDKTLIYQLRLALRAVGHKIVRIHYSLLHDDDDIAKVVQLDIETTVEGDEWKAAARRYTKWCEKTKTHEHIQDDSDSESESGDDENPSN